MKIALAKTMLSRNSNPKILYSNKLEIQYPTFEIVSICKHF